MSDVFWGAFWGNMPTLLGVIAGIVLSILHRQKIASDLTKNRQAVEETKAAVTNGIATTIKEVHKDTNSMREELVKQTALAEFAKGVLAGRAQAAEEQRAKGAS